MVVPAKLNSRLFMTDKLKSGNTEDTENEPIQIIRLGIQKQTSGRLLVKGWPCLLAEMERFLRCNASVILPIPNSILCKL